MQGTRQLADIFEAEVWKMRTKTRYRQYWMATLKGRHPCIVCGQLAVNAEYLETDAGVISKVEWICDSHLNIIM